MTNDLTVGSPTRLIIRFSMPLLLGLIFQQFYSMADTIIVGNTIGVQALAAVGSTGSLNFLVLGFAMGLTQGFAVMIAQRFGAGDEDGVRRSIAASALLCVISTAVITLIAVLTVRPMLELMNTPADIFEDAFSYIVIIFAGIGASVFYNMMACILRSLGDSKTPLLFLIIASLLNVGLDFLFILTFQMGVAGAAWATVLAQLISGFLCLIYSLRRFKLLRLKKADWKINWGFMWAHMRIGLPMAFQFSITAIGCMILQRALNNFGSTVIGAYTAACKIENLVEQPLSAYGATMATYAAQNYGAGKMHRIRQGVRSCTIISVISSVAGGLISVLCCEWLTRIFFGGNDPGVMPEVISYSRTYLIILAIFYIVLGQLFIYRNVLQGIGSNFVPLMAGVSELAMRAISAWVLAVVWKYVGVCLANPVAWVGAAVPLFIKYHLMIRKLDPKVKRLDPPGTSGKEDQLAPELQATSAG